MAELPPSSTILAGVLRAAGPNGSFGKVADVAHRVTIVPGDGIGPEVSQAARLVLDAADVGIEWIERAAGTLRCRSTGR